MDFEHFLPFYEKKSKTHLLSAKKVEKIAENDAQFELIAYFYVFQGKKKQKNHTYYMSNKSKKSSIIRQKNAKIYKKALKNKLIIGLKIRKCGR